MRLLDSHAAPSCTAVCSQRLALVVALAGPERAPANKAVYDRAPAKLQIRVLFAAFLRNCFPQMLISPLFQYLPVGPPSTAGRSYFWRPRRSDYLCFSCFEAPRLRPWQSEMRKQRANSRETNSRLLQARGSAQDAVGDCGTLPGAILCVTTDSSCAEGGTSLGRCKTGKRDFLNESRRQTSGVDRRKIGRSVSLSVATKPKTLFL